MLALFGWKAYPLLYLFYQAGQPSQVFHLMEERVITSIALCLIIICGTTLNQQAHFVGRLEYPAS